MAQKAREAVEAGLAKLRDRSVPTEKILPRKPTVAMIAAAEQVKTPITIHDAPYLPGYDVHVCSMVRYQAEQWRLLLRELESDKVAASPKPVTAGWSSQARLPKLGSAYRQISRYLRQLPSPVSPSSSLWRQACRNSLQSAAYPGCR